MPRTQRRTAVPMGVVTIVTRAPLELSVRAVIVSSDRLGAADRECCVVGFISL